MKKTLRWLGCLSVMNLLACSLGSGPSAVSDRDKTADDSAPVEYLNIVKTAGLGSSLDPFPTSHGFRTPIPTLNDAEMEHHFKGDLLFERNFSDDPTRPEFGLGPVFNNTSCISCHNRDGRGSLPVGLQFSSWKKLTQNEAIFLRISIESPDILARTPTAENHYNEPVPVPGFSGQLFHLGSYQLREDVPGLGQAAVWMKLEKSSFTYPDGQSVELIKPLFRVDNGYDQWLYGLEKSRLQNNDVRFSPRLGMPMFGLGLLEAIPEEDIIEQSQKDFSAQGVHGSLNWVYDIGKAKEGIFPARSLGRFGLKANTPTILHQALGALNGDMGVTNPWFPKESILGTDLFKDYDRRIPQKNEIEASEEISQALVFYSQTLAVPPRRNVEDLDVQAGAHLFQSVQCTTCHRPSWTTGFSPTHSLSRQKIYPFTDMLLHDMGEGLADHRQDFLADGRQWRTRPLWGIGLTQVVNPRASYLHDGRARNLEEAILWHDGEARHSRDLFTRLPRSQRLQVIDFLRSL